MKERIKQVGFWTGIISAAILILGAFGVEVGEPTANAVINAVCSALVMLGIIRPAPASPNDEDDPDADNDGKNQ